MYFKRNWFIHLDAKQRTPIGHEFEIQILLFGVIFPSPLNRIQYSDSLVATPYRRISQRHGGLAVSSESVAKFPEIFSFGGGVYFKAHSESHSQSD